MNAEELAIGANIWARSDERPHFARNEFDGVISDFTIYQNPLSAQQFQALADRLDSALPQTLIEAGETSLHVEPAQIDRGNNEKVNCMFAECAA